MGGTDITSSAVNGNVVLIDDVTENVQITAVAVEKPPEVYAVTFNGTYCASNGANTATENTSYTATITPNTNYKMSSITVTMGGVTQSGVVSGNKVTIPKVTGAIVITAVAVVIPTYTITNNLTQCTNSNGTSSLKEGSSYTATITPKDGYRMDSITVKMGETTLTNAVSGNTITISNITGNVVITAVASEIPAVIPKYNVTFNGTNCTSNGASTVDEGSTYIATITPATGTYEFVMKSVKITMGGTDRTLSILKRKVANGVQTEYDFSNISIPNVTGDIVITAVATDNLLEVAYGRDDLNTNMTGYPQEVFVKSDGSVSLFGGKGYAVNYRASNTQGGVYYNPTGTHYATTGLIPLGNVNDVFYVEGFDKVVYMDGSRKAQYSCWDATGKFIAKSVKNWTSKDCTTIDESANKYTVKRSSSWVIASGTAYLSLTFGKNIGTVQSVKRKKA
jgi:hypothetical protein